MWAIKSEYNINVVIDYNTTLILGYLAANVGDTVNIKLVQFVLEVEQEYMRN